MLCPKRVESIFTLITFAAKLSLQARLSGAEYVDICAFAQKHMSMAASVANVCFITLSIQILCKDSKNSLSLYSQNPSKMKVYIETYGCQMNVNDSEVVLSILKEHGFTRTEDMDRADLILANTCSIRDNAEQRIWGRIEQFRLVKRHNKNVKIGIVGCMAERLKDKLLESGKVDLVCGPDAYRRLPELIGVMEQGEAAIDVQLSRTETYDDTVPERMDSTGVSAFISIMRGCNNVCSYCVVPYTRGVERSREPQSIIREALDLWGRGYKEITLLGQNVDSYNWSEGSEKVDFPGLIEMVANAVH